MRFGCGGWRSGIPEPGRPELWLAAEQPAFGVKCIAAQSAERSASGRPQDECKQLQSVVQAGRGQRVGRAIRQSKRWSIYVGSGRHRCHEPSESIGPGPRGALATTSWPLAAVADVECGRPLANTTHLLPLRSLGDFGQHACDSALPSRNALCRTRPHE